MGDGNPKQVDDTFLKNELRSDSGSVVQRFLLPVQWTIHVRVQPKDGEAAPCAEEQLLPVLLQTLDPLTSSHKMPN